MTSNFKARGIDFDDYFIPSSTGVTIPGYVAPALRYQGGGGFAYTTPEFNWYRKPGVNEGAQLQYVWLPHENHRVTGIVYPVNVASRENVITEGKINATAYNVQVNYQPSVVGANGIRLTTSVQMVGTVTPVEAAYSSWYEFESMGSSTSHVVTASIFMPDLLHSSRPDLKLGKTFDDLFTKTEVATAEVGAFNCKFELPAGAPFGFAQVTAFLNHIVNNVFKNTVTVASQKIVFMLKPKYDKSVFPAAIDYSLHTKEQGYALSLRVVLDLLSSTYVVSVNSLNSPNLIAGGGDLNATVIEEIASGELNVAADASDTDLHNYNIALIQYSPGGRVIAQPNELRAALPVNNNYPAHGMRPVAPGAQSLLFFNSGLLSTELAADRDEQLHLELLFQHKTNGTFFRREIRIKLKTQTSSVPFKSNFLHWSLNEGSAVLAEDETDTANPLVADGTLRLTLRRDVNGNVKMQALSVGLNALFEATAFQQLTGDSGFIKLQFLNEAFLIETLTPLQFDFDPSNPFDELNPRVFEFKIADLRVKDVLRNSALSLRVTSSESLQVQGVVRFSNENLNMGKRLSGVRWRTRMAYRATRTAAQTFTARLILGGTRAEWLGCRTFGSEGQAEAASEIALVTLLDRNYRQDEHDFMIVSVVPINAPSGTTIATSSNIIGSWVSMIGLHFLDIIIPGNTPIGVYDTHNVTLKIRNNTLNTERAFSLITQVNVAQL